VGEDNIPCQHPDRTDRYPGCIIEREYLWLGDASGILSSSVITTTILSEELSESAVVGVVE
jgi:hypothetical protein